MTIEMFLNTIKQLTNGKRMTSAEIERHLHISEEEVRKFTRELRRERLPVLADSRGYFWGTTAEEVEGLIRSLRSRAFDMLETAKDLEPILKEMKGQLTLK